MALRFDARPTPRNGPATQPLATVVQPEERPAPAPIPFPMSWLSGQEAHVLYFRAAAEVLRDPAAELKYGHLPYTSGSALLLALTQQPNGTWNDRLLAVPTARADDFVGVGTIPAAQRLLEYGWSGESPPILHARRILFRLLAEDDDPSLLYELRTRQTDEDLARRGRTILREAAAATLAQAGFEADPRLRGAARRILERIDNFINSPLGAKPWIRSGNKQVLSPDAYPPSFYSVRMLAYMPLLRHEQYAPVDRLYEYLAQPLPRQEPIQVVGKHMVNQPHLVLGDRLPHRNAADADVPFALMWLEMMARLNFLRRNDNWLKLYERFLEDCDEQGVWHPHKGMEAPHSRSPFVWPVFPLSESTSGQARWADVTFRLGLIARQIGREIEPT